MNADVAMKVRKLLTLAGLSTFDGEAVNSLRSAVRAVESSGAKWATWVEGLRFGKIDDGFVQKPNGWDNRRESNRYANPFEDAFRSTFRRNSFDEFASFSFKSSGFAWASEEQSPPKPPEPEPSRKDEEKIARWEAEAKRNSNSKRFFKGF